jgi:hypothetical protein
MNFLTMAWEWGPFGCSPGFSPEPRHRLEAYAMLHCSPECPAIASGPKRVIASLWKAA